MLNHVLKSGHFLEYLNFGALFNFFLWSICWNLCNLALVKCLLKLSLPNLYKSNIFKWSNYGTNARATLDKKSCVITSTLFEMNFTCMCWCDLNFSCLSTSITSAEVSSCQDKRRYPNPIWPTVFTFRVLKHSFREFMTMVSLHVHKST